MRRRNGFTLVELLVVIAIIGVLVALLLPAIQAAREAARRSQCKSQLKQLALGSLNHHDVHGHFQTGGWGWFWVGDPDWGFGKDQPGGWVFNILPYVEQQQLHDMGGNGNKIDTGQALRDQRTASMNVVMQPITIINCPSRRSVGTFPMSTNAGGNSGLFNALTPDEAGRSDYAINSGHVHNEFPNPYGQGPTSYTQADTWTANRSWGTDQPNLRELNGVNLLTGISYERSMIGIRQIPDGTSNTYLIGEKHIYIDDYLTGADRGDNETWCTGFNNDNYRVTSLNNGTASAVPISDNTRNQDANVYRFGSPHPGGVNMSLCDGSVTTISFDIDWQVHRDLGNREDGNAVRLP